MEQRFFFDRINSLTLFSAAVILFGSLLFPHYSLAETYWNNIRMGTSTLWNTDGNPYWSHPSYEHNAFEIMQAPSTVVNATMTLITYDTSGASADTSGSPYLVVISSTWNGSPSTWFSSLVGNFGLGTVVSSTYSTSTDLRQMNYTGVNWSAGDYIFIDFGNDPFGEYPNFNIGANENATGSPPCYGLGFNGSPVYGDINYCTFPVWGYLTSDGNPPPGFYAQIENTPNGRWLLRSSPTTSTDSNFIERLPQDWVVYVSSTANATTSGGYNWYDVVNPTDGVEGWMAASSSDGTAYLQYATSTNQATLEAMATTTTYIVNSTTVYDAIDWYYNNTSTVNSLYSSDDGSNELSMFSDGVLGSSTYSGFPEQIILGIAAHETGGVGFNNRYIHFDYGSGIMQLTPYQVWAHEATSTGWQENTENIPANGSYVEIYPCRSFDEFATPATGTDEYINCYANGGEHSSTDESYIAYGGNSSNPTYMWYANTVQSIYANIKDGMRLLQDNYSSDVGSPITMSTTTGGVTYTPQEQEVILTTEGYGGDCNYVGLIASATEEIDTYFPGVATDTISDLNLLQHMSDAASSSICAQLYSPATLSIQDSSGRTIGMVNGKDKNDFPLAIYDPAGKWAKILSAGTGSYTFKVTGTASSTYGFDITVVHGSKSILLNMRNMLTVPGEIDTYTVNPAAILAGESGVTLQIDTRGDGIIDKTETFNASVVDNNQQNVLTPSTNTASVSTFVDPALVFLKKITSPTIQDMSLNNYTSTILFSTSTNDTTTLEINNSSTNINLPTIQ